jgi:hypothetical protein
MILKREALEAHTRRPGHRGCGHRSPRFLNPPAFLQLWGKRGWGGGEGQQSGLKRGARPHRDWGGEKARWEISVPPRCGLREAPPRVGDGGLEEVLPGLSGP